MTQLPNSFFVLLLIAPLLTACGLVGRQDFPTDLLLTEQDLPSRFVLKEYVTVSVPMLMRSQLVLLCRMVHNSPQFESLNAWLSIPTNNLRRRHIWFGKKKNFAPMTGKFPMTFISSRLFPGIYIVLDMCQAFLMGKILSTVVIFNSTRI